MTRKNIQIGMDATNFLKLILVDSEEAQQLFSYLSDIDQNYSMYIEGNNLFINSLTTSSLQNGDTLFYLNTESQFEKLKTIFHDANTNNPNIFEVQEENGRMIYSINLNLLFAQYKNQLKNTKLNEFNEIKDLNRVLGQSVTISVDTVLVPALKETTIEDIKIGRIRIARNGEFCIAVLNQIPEKGGKQLDDLPYNSGALVLLNYLNGRFINYSKAQKPLKTDNFVIHSRPNNNKHKIYINGDKLNNRFTEPQYVFYNMTEDQFEKLKLILNEAYSEDHRILGSQKNFETGKTEYYIYLPLFFKHYKPEFISSEYKGNREVYCITNWDALEDGVICKININEPALVSNEEQQFASGINESLNSYLSYNSKSQPSPQSSVGISGAKFQNVSEFGNQFEEEMSDDLSAFQHPSQYQC